MSTDVLTQAPLNQMIAPQQSVDETIFNISIRQLSYGYIVEVGCKTFAIETSSKLSSLLTRYLNNPVEVHKQYSEGTLFQTT